METCKSIILGPQCSGKTTLKKYLEQHNPSLPLLEEDELFMELNGGEYPQDIEYKEKILRPKLEERIRQADELVFLTSYCNPKLLEELKSRGYKIFQLELSDEEFQRRNKKRMEEHGYDDANTWAKEVFRFHEEIRESGLVDKVIDATMPTEEIAREIMAFTK